MMGWASAKRVRALEEEVDRLRAEIAELRRHHLRLAELTDVVTELVVPLASRDQERIDRAIDAFNESL
ncbi:hypothetical protein E8D34_09775 [Nocardioides sp. GY 10113]|uniref:DUF6752 domain-containing protein n=1 Tax=Nocardioides sp. GY 10113 TaxID=2569761 RepID=UPI0010A83DF9|nr:DUF6752 domain-containing protein [Nocardioides sp. GY 10113]TIC87411.1 hypothetical protein E8D34_09775 [Nocardioides sp. GY 10113]